MTTKIIISGASGFVGKTLVNYLKKAPEKYSLQLLDISNGIDLTDYNQIKDISHFDVFVHLANLSFVPESYNRPKDFYYTNIISTLNSLEICRQHGGRMVYISSYVYGKPFSLPVNENHPIQPFNPYAQSKVICEQLCEAYYRDFGVISTILRPFNIYGAGQNGKLLIPEIVEQLKNGNDVFLKDPFPKRDYINVKDVADAIARCIDTKFVSFDTYNICSGVSYSVKELTEIFNKNLKTKASFNFGSSDRKIEVNETKGDYTKLNKETGWCPTISLDEGIAEIVEFENL